MIKSDDVVDFVKQLCYFLMFMLMYVTALDHVFYDGHLVFYACIALVFLGCGIYQYARGVK